MTSVKCNKKKMTTFGNHSLEQSNIIKTCFNNAILNTIYVYKLEEYTRLYKKELSKLKKRNNKKNKGKDNISNNSDKKYFSIVHAIEKLKSRLGHEDLSDEDLLSTYALIQSKYIHIELYEPDHPKTLNRDPGKFTSEKGFVKIFLPKDVFYLDSLPTAFRMYIEAFLSDEPEKLRKKIYSISSEGIFLWNVNIEEDIKKQIDLYKDTWREKKKSRCRKASRYNKNSNSKTA